MVAVRDRLRQRQGGKRGPLTGPNPTDRGKPGSKVHLITDRNGLPLSLGISGANMHDSLGLKPLVRGIPPIHSRRGPRRRRPAKLHAGKGYDYDHLRRWLRKRGIHHRIARKGIESSQQLGRHHWVVEKTNFVARRMPTPAPPLRTQGRATSSPSSASPQPSSTTADSTEATSNRSQEKSTSREGDLRRRGTRSPRPPPARAVRP